MDVEPFQPSSAPPGHLLSQARSTPRPSFVPAPKKGANAIHVSPDSDLAKPWVEQNKSLLFLAQKAKEAREARAASASGGSSGSLSSSELAARVAAVKQVVAARSGQQATGVAPRAGQQVTAQVVPARVTVNSDKMTLFLDEVYMPSRPQVPPTPYDREVFVDPIPAEDGSEELQEWLKTFGEVEEIHRISGEDRGYLLFKEPEAAAKCVTAFAGTWSESERATTGQKSSRRNQCAYPESLISHFAGQDGANIKDMSSRLGISSFQLLPGSTARGDKGEATRARFVASGSTEQLTMLRREIEEQLEKVHREMTRLIEEAAPCKVAVRGFSASSSIDEVKGFFSAHEVSHADITRSGFATIEFQSSSEARRAAVENDGRNLDVMASNSPVLRCTLECPWGGSAPANEDVAKDDREGARSSQKRPRDNDNRTDNSREHAGQERHRREAPNHATPPGLPSREEIEDFILANGVDEQAAGIFREVDPEVQARVIERGLVADKKNPSAALLTRVKESRQDVEKGRGKRDGGRRNTRDGEKGRGRQRHEREDPGRGSDDRRYERGDLANGDGKPDEGPRYDEWERLHDETQDAFYYFNHITGESSWYPPEARPPRAPERSPERPPVRPPQANVPRPSSVYDMDRRRDLDRPLPARGQLPPTRGHIEEFLRRNPVDQRPADDLRDCPPEVQARVIAKGDLAGTRNPSGVLMSRIRDARAEVGRHGRERSRSHRRRRRR